MANEITLPKLSDTMEEGKVLRWLKKVGDPIAAGDVVAEVETDKADMEVEAAAAGVLSEIRVQVGETAAVGAVLGVLDGAASASGRKSEPKAPKSTEDEAAADDVETAGDAAKGDVKPEEPAPAAKEEGKRPAAKAAVPAKEEQPSRPLRVSPLAQRLARERGVDLEKVRGSGAEGKVVARDVEARGDGEARPLPDPPPEAGGGRSAQAMGLEPGRHELSRMRQSIARRMTEAKNAIPHFTVTAEIGMDEAAHLLEALKKQVDAKITVSHLVTKACAMALLLHPRVNGQWDDGAILIPAEINIGLAVAVDDGLIVPVIHGCQSLSLREIAAEARKLVTKAREGRFAGDDLKGGTFSISNLGILDVDEFAAIINPPQAAILAVGSIKQRPIVRDGQLAVGRTMRVTLSCDHRQLNGVEGARYLETLRSILENPLQMVV